MSFSTIDAELLESLGDSATYSDGTKKTTLNVLLERGVVPLDDGYTSVRQTHALIADRDVSPRAGHTITIGSTTYTVASLVEDDGYLYRVHVI